MVGAIFHVLILLGLVAAPLAIYAIVIHWLEQITLHRLAERFGWKSVLWTGWLGTPIHELSHAAMCVLFNHRIDKIALFEPDKRSGRLGYVRHSYRKNNWYEKIGNVFIGIAPLIGGSIALLLLLLFCYPAALKSVFDFSRTSQIDGNFQVLSMSFGIFKEVFTLSNIATIRFWIFIYIVLCIGTHMAPSPSDYEGVFRGLLIFVAIVLVSLFLFVIVQSDIQKTIRWVSQLISPLLAILMLTVCLCSIATGMVYLLTGFFRKRYRVIK